MKKLYCFFMIMIVCCFSICFGINRKTKVDVAYSSAQTTTYAKASANCTLYKNRTMSNELGEVYFVVPETYFVTVLEIVSDACMKVQYADYVGYVKSETVVVVTFVPIVKTLENIKFDIKETSGTQVWLAPSSSSKVLATIPAGKKDISYISFAYGNIPSGGESNIWYYVRYTPESSSTSVYEGYVYSENVTNVSEIVANAESNPEVIKVNDKTDGVIEISSSIRTLLIALIAVPVILLIAIILYKFVKNMHNFRHKELNFAENEFENSEPNEQHISQNMHNNNLRDRIKSLKNIRFVRKNNSQKIDNFSYPTFPTYDSDDDLL